MELEVPPGLYRNGTQFQSRGRWYDGSLVRWHGGATQPVGGWKAIAMTGEEVQTLPVGSTGFGGYPPGQEPVGWEDFVFRNDKTWWITEPPDTDYPVMTFQGGGHLTKNAMLWSPAGEMADGEILARARFLTSNNSGSFGVVARANGEFPFTGVYGVLTRASVSAEGEFVPGVQTRMFYGTGRAENSSNADPWTPGGEIRVSGAPFPSFPAAYEDWVWLRFNFQGSRYRLKAWVDGTEEPEEWDVDVLFTNPGAPTGSGGVGFAFAGANSSSAPEFSVFAYSGDPDTPAKAASPGDEDAIGGVSLLQQPILGALAWRDNDNVPWLAMGTPTNCWIYSEGLARTIMPSSFADGSADGSTEIAGYGTGAYGAGLYGEGVVNSVGTVLEAQSWQFDTFGELLIAHAHSDPNIWVWNPQGDEAQRLHLHEGTPGEQVSFVPRHNQGIVVTPERFLVALGADEDPRNIRWADQETLGIWTPTPENQAGDFVLPGSGIIMCGSRARQETLIWTTQDLFTMQYIGGTLVYSFAQVGTNCGIISRRGYAMVDGARALWMGTDSFFAYEGGVTPLVCEVGDDVFNDINTTQASKIFAVVFSEFSEVWWFYPSKDSDEVDKYVAYNYAEAHWSMGDLSRTAGVPRGVFPHPILMSRLGQVYDHERGGEYFDLDGETPLLPFIESGPIDIAQGDQTMWVRYIVPDENTLGDTRAYLKSRLYPTATENTFGPFSMAEPTSTRMSGRQVSLRVEQVQPGWRLGVPRLEVVPAGRR